MRARAHSRQAGGHEAAAAADSQREGAAAGREKEIQQQHADLAPSYRRGRRGRAHARRIRQRAPYM